MAAKQVELELLGQVSLFQGLSTKDLRGVLGEMKEMTFAAGEVVVEEGGREGRFYLVVEGDQSGRTHQGPDRAG